jgi:hypothetical protein
MSRYEIEEVISQPIKVEEPVKVDIQPEELPILPTCEKQEEINEPIIEEIEEPIQPQIVCPKHKFFGTLKDKNIQPTKKKIDNNFGTYLLIGSLIATIGVKLF